MECDKLLTSYCGFLGPPLAHCLRKFGIAFIKPNIPWHKLHIPIEGLFEFTFIDQHLIFFRNFVRNIVWRNFSFSIPMRLGDVPSEPSFLSSDAFFRLGDTSIAKVPYIMLKRPIASFKTRRENKLFLDTRRTYRQFCLQVYETFCNCTRLFLELPSKQSPPLAAL